MTRWVKSKPSFDGQPQVELIAPEGSRDARNRDGGRKLYAFDHVFDPGTQEEIYDALGRQCLDHALEGFNASVFAYGMTGSGKTHTMMGTPEDPGVIMRVRAVEIGCALCIISAMGLSHAEARPPAGCRGSRALGQRLLRACTPEPLGSRVGLFPRAPPWVARLRGLRVLCDACAARTDHSRCSAPLALPARRGAAGVRWPLRARVCRLDGGGLLPRGLQRAGKLPPSPRGLFAAQRFACGSSLCRGSRRCRAQCLRCLRHCYTRCALHSGTRPALRTASNLAPLGGVPAPSCRHACMRSGDRPPFADAAGARAARRGGED